MRNLCYIVSRICKYHTEAEEPVHLSGVPAHPLDMRHADQHLPTRGHLLDQTRAFDMRSNEPLPSLKPLVVCWAFKLALLPILLLRRPLLLQSQS